MQQWEFASELADSRLHNWYLDASDRAGGRVGRALTCWRLLRGRSHDAGDSVLAAPPSQLRR